MSTSIYISWMSRCDTTSTTYKKGKIQIFNVQQKSPHFCQSVNVIYRAESKQAEVIEDGEEFLVALKFLMQPRNSNATSKRCI